jgi:hypothetical protein
LILIIVSAFLIFNRQRVLDQITVWQYKPSAEIGNLAKRAGMNENGKFYYYASRPELFLPSNAANFNKVCANTENTTAILGCYSNFRIYIYDVTDAQLDGIREVTAAHETLHAIYNRLSDAEKKGIDSLVETEYTKLKNDSKFADLMSFYARTEPGQRDNELHSIIGTEVAPISPELEKYYSKYFSDRQKVVTLDAKYSGVFRELKNRANELEDQITKLRSSINTRTKQYNDDSQVLNSDIDNFNAKANSNQFTITQFNYERSLLQNRVTELDQMRDSINVDRQLYENLLTEHNKIASESNKLYKAIDSTLAPAPSV